MIGSGFRPEAPPARRIGRTGRTHGEIAVTIPATKAIPSRTSTALEGSRTPINRLLRFESSNQNEVGVARTLGVARKGSAARSVVLGRGKSAALATRCVLASHSPIAPEQRRIILIRALSSVDVSGAPRPG